MLPLLANQAGALMMLGTRGRIRYLRRGARLPGELGLPPFGGRKLGWVHI
jgi:hypothetical protein